MSTAPGSRGTAASSGSGDRVQAPDDQEGHEREEKDHEEEADRWATAEHGLELDPALRKRVIGTGHLGSLQHLLGGLGPGLRDQDVAWPRGEEVGHVESRGAAVEARNPLFEEEALDQLGLRLVARVGDLHGLAARV